MNISTIIEESIAVKQAILQNPEWQSKLESATGLILEAFRNNKKILFCGNGGSAADAQHLAAEFTGRFYKDREALYAEAIHCNTSYMTAVANDYSFDDVYARYIKGCGYAGDVLIAISTSGNSTNIIKACEAARANNMKVIAMTGESGGKLKDLSDLCLNVPSANTPRIQESHIMLGHILCEWVEKEYFS